MTGAGHQGAIEGSKPEESNLGANLGNGELCGRKTDPAFQSACGAPLSACIERVR